MAHAAHHPATDPPVKKRRVFLWFFLAVQALFVLWLVVGLSTANPQGDAEEVGTAIGAGIIVAVWVAVDFILGLTYLIYRLARRP